MKRIDLVRHLKIHGCVLAREGANHSVFFNMLEKRTSTVPRHQEISAFLAKKICKDLAVPPLEHKR